MIFLLGFSAKRKIKTTELKEAFVFIASDGTEFTSRYSCLEYENELREKMVSESEDIVIGDHLAKIAPIGMDPYSEDELIWLMPKNETGLRLLEDVYDDEYGGIHFEIGKWTCVAMNYDFTTYEFFEDSMKDEVVRLFLAMGYKVKFEKIKEKE